MTRLSVISMSTRAGRPEFYCFLDGRDEIALAQLDRRDVHRDAGRG